MSGFKRGMERSKRRQELTAQRAMTTEHLKLKEQFLEGALTARRTGTGPKDDHIESLMLDWSIIREELAKGKAR